MKREVVNTTFSQDLKGKRYEAYDYPITLLHAANKIRVPWVAKKIAHHFSDKNCSVIDIGCGDGVLSNALAHYGHHVTGIDLWEESLEVAREKDTTHSVFYCQGNGYALPFSEQQFEVVCAMDILEQAEEPIKVIEQASRVLKPGGLFFFHTFNRTWFNWLFAIKGAEWFVPNTPPNKYLYKLLIRPEEMHAYLGKHAFSVCEICGLKPTLNKDFCKQLLQRRINPQFSFNIVPSLKCGYMGYAVKMV